MAKGIELVDLAQQPCVFLWDSNQEQIINLGQEALDWWQWHRLESGNESWKLIYPLRAGILQSKWALEQVLENQLFFDQFRLKTATRLQVVVSGANSDLEKECIKNLFEQKLLKPVAIIDRADFFYQYLALKQDYSKLKLIIDLNLDFAELSLFLLDKKLKTQHLPFTENLTETVLIKRLQSAVDRFILNVPSQLFQEKWQYFYFFMHPAIDSSSIVDDLSQHLKMEGILNQEPLTSYV